VTIADVAEAAGVSKTSVSFAFNSPERLGGTTALRIREVADSLGYRPHPVARALGQRRTGTIGVLTPQALSIIFSNPFFGALSEGIALAAEDSGYGLTFISPLHGSLANAMRRAAVDGCVSVGLAADHPEVEQVRRAGLPLVSVDSSALPDSPSVGVDDEGGARAAAEHLLGLGHQRFIVLAVEPPHPGGHDTNGVVGRRLFAYREALAEAGVELPDEAVFAAPASIAGGIAAFTRAWDGGLRPTAVLAMSDAMALGAIRAIRDQGRSVPGDVSVVGFDDLDLAQLTDPPLTTVHQPVRRKGEEAVRLLVSLIDGRAEERPEHRRLETRLVVRASTGPPPAEDRR